MCCLGLALWGLFVRRSFPSRLEPFTLVIVKCIMYGNAIYRRAKSLVSICFSTVDCILLFSDTFTVSQAINALGFGKFQVMLSLFTGLCWMADSMEMMILSILSPALHCDWKIDKYQEAFLTTVRITVIAISVIITSGNPGALC